MRLPTTITSWLFRTLVSRYAFKRPDFCVGGRPDPHINRWHIVRWHGLFNVYLHEIRRSDHATLHDHPWWSIRLMLRGSYIDCTRRPNGAERRTLVYEGDIHVHSGRYTHRIEVNRAGERAWTLFITGPKYREWGFHCPKGWVPWQKFHNDHRNCEE